jgi:putative ABC transport system permease protein
MSMRHGLDLAWHDLRHSIRAIRTSGPLSVAVVLTLVVGVSMNAVVVSLFNALLFRPHVAKDPSSYVQIYVGLSGQWQRELHGPPWLGTLEDYNLIRAASRTLSDVTASRWTSFTLGGEASASLRGMLTSCNYLSAHLAHPMRLGRGFVDADCARPGGMPVVVLAEGAWQRHFASDPQIVGRVVRLNDVPLTVVGVAPDDPMGEPVRAMVYVPFTMQPVLQGPTDYFARSAERHAWLAMAGRLHAGRTHDDAQAELTVLAAGIDRLHPGQVTGLVVTDGAIIKEPETGRQMPLLIGLCLGTTLLILAMVCANVTTLLLARAVERRHDTAVRMSLGGTRWRLMRQLLTEMALLGGVSAFISIPFTYWASPRLAQALTDFPLAGTFAPDWRVFAVTFGLAFAAGCAAGVTPALESLRFGASGSLKPAGRTDAGPVAAGLRGTLLATQLSIGLALLITTALIVRAQERLLRLTLDYDAGRTLVTRIDLPSAGYTGPAARTFYDQFLPRVQGLPGVKAVALASPAPFAGPSGKSVTVEGARATTVVVPTRSVTPPFFSLAGLQLLEGRLFTDLECREVAPVMPLIVSASFAKMLPAGGSALGRRVHFGNGDIAEVVGVVSDTVSVRPTEQDDSIVYQPISAANLQSLATILRFDGDGRPLSQAMLSSARAIDRRPLVRSETVADTIAREAGHYTAVLKLTALPASVALFLSIVAVYGLTNFAAVQRRQEIGVRIALGARTRDVVALFLVPLRRPFAIGAIGGTVVSALGVVLLGRTRVLPDVSVGDPLALAAAIVLMLCTAVSASLIPALRAARRTPWAVLRDP